MENKTCAIICAYNEENKIKEIVDRSKNYGLETIIVNDGSTDSTLEEAQKTNSIILNIFPNQGKGNALKKGFDYALKENYEQIITLDADGQHLPEEIPSFIKKLENGYEVVIGKRDFNSKNVPLARKYGNTIDSLILSKILKKELHDPQNGFRAFKKDTLLKFYNKPTGSGFPYELELLIKIAREDIKIGWNEISTIYSNEIESKINPRKHIIDSLKLYGKCLLKKI
jgi:glycosyltransferase involved in cell wall biosynthesis